MPGWNMRQDEVSDDLFLSLAPEWILDPDHPLTMNHVVSQDQFLEASSLYWEEAI